MTIDCQLYRGQIPKAMLGDLEAADQQALERHLADCSACAREKESYAGTLVQLESLEDEDVPRHFFVHPEERRADPWHLFLKMPPAWQAACAAVFLLFGVMTSLAVSRFQVRAENGAWTISFGKLPPPPFAAPPVTSFDAASLEAKILQIVEEKNRKESLEWVRTLRSEIARSQKNLTQQQRIALDAALGNLESRMGSRIEQNTRYIQERNERSLSGLYQAVSRQRDLDLAAINGRFDRLAVTDEIKNSQTDAILETLLQVAELRLK